MYTEGNMTNIISLNKYQIVVPIALVIALFVLLTNFSPFDNPMIVPVAITIISLISLVTMMAIKDRLKLKIGTSTLVHLNIIIGVLASLFSLHQLRVTDMALVFGLYLLLRVYSNR
jgi:hypothetical protein